MFFQNSVKIRSLNVAAMLAGFLFYAGNVYSDIITMGKIDQSYFFDCHFGKIKTSEVKLLKNVINNMIKNEHSNYIELRNCSISSKKFKKIIDTLNQTTEKNVLCLHGHQFNAATIRKLETRLANNVGFSAVRRLTHFDYLYPRHQPFKDLDCKKLYKQFISSKKG